MSATYKLLRFGVFELNLSTEELRKDGTLVKLSPQPFELLVLLASHAGQIVTREEIHQKLWDDDTFVDFEQGMNKCIKQIRNILNDDADHPVYIETLPRRGYRFLAPVTSKFIEAPAPRVTASSSGIQERPDLGSTPSLVTSSERRSVLDLTPITSSGALHAAGPAALPLSSSVAARATTPEETSPVRRMWWRRRSLAWFVGGVLVAGVVGYYWRTQSVSAFNERDTIVLADFVNSTGEAVFDDTLRQALAIQLEQSPYLNILSDSEIAKTLQLMARPANTALTPEVTRELCLRAGSKAYVAGSIDNLGSKHVLGLKAVNCQTGDLLAQEQVTASTKEKVLDALGKSAGKLRRELGESLATVEKFDFPVEATTSSLEALKNYSMGIKITREKGEAPSIPFFKHAIEQDPSFPLAYAELGIAYNNLNESSLASEYSTKAYELRDRVTEREKLRISADYFLVRGERDKEVETYAPWIASYPRDFFPHGNLGVNYAATGQWDKALAEFQQALRLAPDNVNLYEGLGGTYLSLNRLGEAKATFDQALANNLDEEGLRPYLYDLAFLQGDFPQMEHQLASTAGKPGEEDVILTMQSDTEAYYGRLNQARHLSHRAVDSAVRADAKETAALWQINAALREAELGNTALARQGTTTALALSSGRDVKVFAALTLARIGDILRAKILAEELARDYPTNTMLRLYWLPTINAAIELDKGNPSRAIELLEAAAPYELGQAEMQISFLYPAYLRGQAYLRANNGTEAAAEFQKMLDHKGIVLNFVTGSLAHLQTGRAYAMADDNAKAKSAYQDFFSVWRNADPDIPILQQAKAEYAKLQ